VCADRNTTLYQLSSVDPRAAWRMWLKAPGERREADSGGEGVAMAGCGLGEGPPANQVRCAPKAIRRAQRRPVRALSAYAGAAKRRVRREFARMTTHATSGGASGAHRGADREAIARVQKERQRRKRKQRNEPPTPSSLS